MRIAEKYDLWVIEDCCDALGSRYNGQLVGSFGDIATLSFYPAHHITMGEGGALLTNDSQLKVLIESFRDWGRDCWCDPGKDNTCGKRFQWQPGDLPFGYDHKYVYSHIGYNLKITDFQAAVGLAQLARANDFIARRRANFACLCERLKPFEEFLILPEATPNSEPSWFGFPITVRPEAPFSRLELLTFYDAAKIGSRLLFCRKPHPSARLQRCSIPHLRRAPEHRHRDEPDLLAWHLSRHHRRDDGLCSRAHRGSGQECQCAFGEGPVAGEVFEHRPGALHAS